MRERAAACSTQGVPVRAMAHITGGGMVGNLSRVIPDGLSARLDFDEWKIPPVFRALQDLGGIADQEMFRTFNMGVGYVLVVPRSGGRTQARELLDERGRAGASSWGHNDVSDRARAPEVTLEGVLMSVTSGGQCDARRAVHRLPDRRAGLGQRLQPAGHHRPAAPAASSCRRRRHDRCRRPVAARESARAWAPRIEVVLVISDVPGARALERAVRRRHPPRRCSPIERLRRPRRSTTWPWSTPSREAEPDLVVLAGYMRIVSPALLKAFPWRVINLHPALLPAFPGTTSIGDALRLRGQGDRGDGALRRRGRRHRPGHRPGAGAGGGRRHRRRRWRRASTRWSTSCCRTIIRLIAAGRVQPAASGKPGWCR